MKLYKLIFSFIVFIFILSACNVEKIEKPNELDYRVQYFRYTTQHNVPFSLSDVSGQVWIANFIYTNCKTDCIEMTQNMAKLQQQLKENEVDAQLISFTVDPKVDTPEKLVAFAKQFNADFSNWTFLTGYSEKDIQEFAKKSFEVTIQRTNSNDIKHGTSFYLVDQTGIVVKSYQGVENPPYDEMIDDIEALKGE